MTRTTQPEAAAGLPEDEDFIVEGTGQLSIAAMQSLTDANPQQEAGAELSGNAGDLALETAIDWMELAAAMLGRGEMPAPGSAYAANWCMAHGVVLEAARRSMSQPQQEGASLPGGEGLKPCPMCGSGIIRERLALGESWVRCDDCGMTTDMFGSHERAIAAWNRRPEPPSLPADGDGALPASPSGGQWRTDFENLPKSGRALFYRPLAEATNDEVVAVKTIVNGSRDVCWYKTIPEGQTAFNPTGGMCHVTHWMPLPDAPSMGMEARQSRNEPQTPAPTTLNSGRDRLIDLIDGNKAFVATVEDEHRLWLARILVDEILAALRPAGDYEGLIDDAAAERFCELVNWSPDGSEWKTVEGVIHEITFRDLAKGYMRTTFAALRQLTGAS